MQNNLHISIDEDEIREQIKEHKNQFDFDIREYPLEVLIQKFNPSQQEDPEIFIPDYQREFVWTKKQQSLFIESLLIGLPVPYIFVADIADEEEDYAEGRIEIVDGVQRMSTIYAYMNNELQLQDLPKLKLLNNSYFKDLPIANQRRFGRSTIRLIELKNINDVGRRLMFERLNTGGSKLTDMEVRLGANSTFVKFIRELALEKEIRDAIPLSQEKEKRREREEYILRFFAYRERYQNFGKRNDGTTDNSVIGFLNDYIDDTDKIFNDEMATNLRQQFFEMLSFVNNHFSCGFRKSKNAKNVTRIRFEAIAVGSSLALEEYPDLKPENTQWAYHDSDFLSMIRSDASNSKIKIINRIEFVKNHLLGNPDLVTTES